jgi:hypothetical protein
MVQAGRSRNCGSFAGRKKLIYLLIAIGLTPGGSSTVHIYTQTIHRTTQNKRYIEYKNFGRVRAVPRLASYTLAFALQLRKKHGEPSARVAEEYNEMPLYSTASRAALGPL